MIFDLERRGYRESCRLLVNTVVPRVPYPAGVNEPERTGISAETSTRVNIPRTFESPVSLECRELVSLGIGDGRSETMTDPNANESGRTRTAT